MQGRGKHERDRRPGRRAGAGMDEESAARNILHRSGVARTVNPDLADEASLLPLRAALVGIAEIRHAPVSARFFAGEGSSDTEACPPRGRAAILAA